MATRAFLAYAHEDRTAADAIVAQLADAAVDVFYDAALGSGDWQDRLAAEIRSRGHFIWLMSPHSVASKEVVREFTIAREHGVACHIVALGPVSRESALADVRRLNWIPRERLLRVISEMRAADSSSPAGWLARARTPSLVGTAIAIALVLIALVFFRDRDDSGDAAVPPDSRSARRLARVGTSNSPWAPDRRDPAPRPQEDPVERLLYFVVDRSSRMKEAIGFKGSRLQAAIAAMSEELYAMDPRHDRIGLRLFGGDCLDARSSDLIISLDEGVPSGATLVEKLRGVEPAGECTLLPTMRMSLNDIQAARDSHPGVQDAVMIVITSSDDTCVADQAIADSLVNDIRAAAVSVKYKFLGLADGGVLQRRAESLLGTYASLASGVGLRVALQRIFEDSTVSGGASASVYDSTASAPPSDIENDSAARVRATAERVFGIGSAGSPVSAQGESVMDRVAAELESIGLGRVPGSEPGAARALRSDERVVTAWLPGARAGQDPETAGEYVVLASTLDGDRGTGPWAASRDPSTALLLEVARSLLERRTMPLGVSRRSVLFAVAQREDALASSRLLGPLRPRDCSAALVVRRVGRSCCKLLGSLWFVLDAERSDRGWEKVRELGSPQNMLTVRLSAALASTSRDWFPAGSFKPTWCLQAEYGDVVSGGRQFEGVSWLDLARQAEWTRAAVVKWADESVAGSETETWLDLDSVRSDAGEVRRLVTHGLWMLDALGFPDPPSGALLGDAGVLRKFERSPSVADGHAAAAKIHEIVVRIQRY